VDERRFGPAFQFLHDHRVLDEQGNLKGYRNLDAIREKLAPIFLRRTRGEVLGQLPARTDNTVYIELTTTQKTLYEDQAAALARLIQKGYYTDLDRKRILACLANLRMICDSAFLVDESSHVSPKLDELKIVLPELLEEGDHKVVIFSQWETMIRETAVVLESLDIGFSILHGSLSGKERKAALDRFRNEKECRVFLSTDAGGVGLNLQTADTVINLELPWNPAVLEQRIARVHRLGQSRPVRVLNFVARGTIEERVLRTLERKQQLFSNFFAGDDDELAFEAINPASLTTMIKTLFSDPPPEHEERTPTADVSPVLNATLAMLEALTAFLAESGVLPEGLKNRAGALGLKLEQIAKSSQRSN
jgi:SNF2 family DNA or RNA helicase